jgi:hypothetical protein
VTTALLPALAIRSHLQDYKDLVQYSIVCSMPMTAYCSATAD